MSTTRKMPGHAILACNLPEEGAATEAARHAAAEAVADATVAGAVRAAAEVVGVAEDVAQGSAYRLGALAFVAEEKGGRSRP
jgi:hypothetical protein